MFGKISDRRVMVYEYGCRPPVSGLDQLIDTLAIKNRLWNRLVELHREHVTKVRAILPPIEGVEELIRLKNDLAGVRTEIKEQRRKARTGSTVLSDLKKQASTLKERIAEQGKIYRANKESRKSIIATHKEALQAAEDELRQRAKDAAKESGLWWLHTEDIINRFNTARFKVMANGQELKFHRFDGSGSVYIRYQKGRPAKSIFEPDTLLQMSWVDSKAWSSPSRAERRRLCRSRVKIRVGSEKRCPVFVELPFYMHRPIPEDGDIRIATLVRERVGMGFRYKLCLTVAQKGLAPERKGNRTVGIDLGWRVVALHPKHAKGVVVYGLHEPFNASSAPSEILTRGRISGIRVAYWHDERGRRGQLILPIENVELFRKPSELRSILDDKFNHVKADLDSLLKPCKDVPGWFADVIKALPQWRAPVRLYRLFRRWERERFVGDERAFAVLDAWVERFRHLRSWEDNLRDQNIANRREIYRRFAAWLADQYDVVAMEEFDLSRVARTSPAEDGTAKQNYSADNRRLVAPSSLVSIIKKTLGREGVRIIEVNAAHTTTECHECGHVETFDSAAHLVRNCSACGAVYDQDDNASINIKKRAKN